MSLSFDCAACAAATPAAAPAAAATAGPDDEYVSRSRLERQSSSRERQESSSLLRVGEPRRSIARRASSENGIGGSTAGPAGSLLSGDGSILGASSRSSRLHSLIPDITRSIFSRLSS